MKFEIIQNGERIFYTEQVSCIPLKEHIDIMNKTGCKFKLDGKVATKKIIEELLKERKNNENKNKETN